jgi:hypothetical protein
LIQTREAGRDAIAVKVLRDDGFGRLSHHGIARARILVVEIPLPEFGTLEPAACRGQDQTWKKAL